LSKKKDLLKKTFTVRIFNSLQKTLDGILSGKPRPIKPGDAIVCHYEGPRGGPAVTECLSIIRALITKQIKDVAIIADGRFSGWTKGYLSIGHVCPEAQVGGSLALLQDGDRILVDIPGRRLNVQVP
jgi:dihydroxy-acid dehydratase